MQTTQETAHKAEDVHRLFLKRFNEGDLEGLAALYEDNAILVFRDQVLRGKARIRVAIIAPSASRPTMTLRTEKAVEGDGLALLTSSWKIDGKGMDGEPFQDGGRTADVMRRQPDGAWLAAIDSPYGGGS